MFGLSLGHILIFGIVVLLFGHKRLPELGHALGKALGAFKKGLQGKDHDYLPPKSDHEHLSSKGEHDHLSSNSDPEKKS